MSISPGGEAPMRHDPLYAELFRRRQEGLPSLKIVTAFLEDSERQEDFVPPITEGGEHEEAGDFPTRALGLPDEDGFAFIATPLLAAGMVISNTDELLKALGWDCAFAIAMMRRFRRPLTCGELVPRFRAAISTLSQ